MTFLVAGGSGFIGLNVIEELLSSSEQVISLDKSPIPPAAINVFSKLPGKFASIELDITNAEDVNRVISESDVDVIFYGAAITAGVEREISNPLSVFDVNVAGLLNVLEAACRLPSVKRIINISSGSAYGNGGFGDTGWKDNLDEFGTREDPRTLYAISKYTGERVAISLGDILKIRVINVRLSAIFGRWEYDTGVRDTLSAPMQATLLALKGATALIDRKEERDWTYSRDVARALYNWLIMKMLTLLSIILVPVKPGVSSIGAVFKMSYPDFNYRLCEFGEVPNIDLFGTRDRIKMSPDRFLCDIGYTLSADLNEIFEDFKIWLMSRMVFGISNPERSYVLNKIYCLLVLIEVGYKVLRRKYDEICKFYI